VVFPHPTGAAPALQQRRGVQSPERLASPVPSPTQASGIRSLARDSAGASLPEYALIAGTILLAGFAAFKLLGGNNRQDAQCGADLVAGNGGNCSPGPGGPQPIALSNAPSPGAGHGSGPQASGGFCTATACYDGKHCFAAGTPVVTRDGLRPIERIQTADEVLSADPSTGALFFKRVVVTFVTPDQPLVAVRISGQRDPIRATPGHAFYTLDRGWVPAEALAPGEMLGSAVGGSRPHDTLSGSDAVDAIGRALDRATVFNLEVEDTHTYFVGDARVLVHNVNPCNPFETPPPSPGPSTNPFDDPANNVVQPGGSHLNPLANMQNCGYCATAAALGISLGELQDIAPYPYGQINPYTDSQGFTETQLAGFVGRLGAGPGTYHVVSVGSLANPNIPIRAWATVNTTQNQLFLVAYERPDGSQHVIDAYKTNDGRIMYVDFQNGTASRTLAGPLSKIVVIPTNMSTTNNPNFDLAKKTIRVTKSGIN
jgi:hypothetical protein